jgi:Na+/H+ antiporter NhaD/arsenite permease-like protein
MDMFILMVIVFILGYTAIALEHPLKVNKAATALITNMFEIMRYFISHHELYHHLAEISRILFFLLGAMTIVEIVDQHQGFRIITDKIKTNNKVKLLWILSFLTFFMSAALDNLTTTIVMIALLRKLITNQKTRWFFASMVVLAANAGGAWSPIGDVTTIMLWIGGQVTTINIITMVQSKNPMALCQFGSSGCKCRRCMVTNRRCNNNHALDWRTSYNRKYHNNGYYTKFNNYDYSAYSAIIYPERKC